MGIYTTTEDVAFNELIELHNKTTETEIKRITGNAISMIQGKNGQIWELLCEIDSLEDGVKKQEEQAEQILAVLKEQKEKRIPKAIIHGRKEEYWDIEEICPDCGKHWMSAVVDTTHFCPGCGRAVKWE